MKLKGLYAAFAVLVSVSVVSVNGHAQKRVAAHVGIPQDWTLRQIVFTRDGLLKHPDAIDREPRVRFKAALRWQHHSLAAVPGMSSRPLSSIAISSLQDWNASLGTGRVAPNMYPAKYGFDPYIRPDCSSDYVVFGLSAVGSGTQANLVAFNNLYAGAGGYCGASPTVLFGYNATTVPGGRISTSPVLSLDGTKIAFVESSPTLGRAIFHVLTWTGGQGTVTAAAVPTLMTSLTYSPTANSTTSAPWVDYGTDTAYVGADNGKLYKIHPVFTGTPALVTTAPWPITVSNNFRLSLPVVDSFNGYIVVGSANGNLYEINLSTGALNSLAVGKTGQKNPGILAPPVVDVTSGTMFVVSANDGITGGVLVEADTATLTQLAKVQLGIASLSGAAVSLYQPALSNDYYNDPVTGVIRSCGTGIASTEPWQYSFGFTIVNNQPVINSTPSFSQQLLTSTAARCTGWTEFFNQNIPANVGTDFFFFGLSKNCVGTSGCIAATTGDTPAAAAAVPGGPSGIVVDNDSTLSQASSIYFSGQGVNRAYKFAQSALLP